jgi:hypothetical protein
MKLAAGIAALLVSLSLPNVALAYGAIAVDDEVGDDEPGYGLAVGEDDRESAKKAALKFCRERGNEHCKVVVWFKQCGAYAASKKYYGYGYGATKEIAGRNALEMCGNGNCKVKIADCED